MKRATVLPLLAVLLIAACASTASGPTATPQQAQKALTEAQATRVAVRDSIAKAYVTAQGNLAARPVDPTALRLMQQAEAARTAFNRVDPQFTAAWQVAAVAVDSWLAAPSSQTAADKFNTVFASVTKSLSDLSAIQSGAKP